MDPEDELELELELARARASAKGGREKMGRGEAGTLGALSGMAFGFDDEILQSQAYAKKLAELGYKAGPDGALDALNPGVDLGRMLFDPGYKPKPPPELTREEAVKQAGDYARAERDSLRKLQREAGEDRPVTHFIGELGGGAVTLPAGGGVGKGLQGAGALAAKLFGKGAVKKVAAEGAAKAATGEVVKKVFMTRLAQMTGRGAVAGAGYSSLTAAGKADDADRWAAAREAVIPGAAAGAVIAPAAKALSTGAGALWNVLTRTPDQKAVAVLARLMNKDGVTTQAAKDLVDQRTAGNSPHFETAGETMGPGAAGMQTALSTVTGPSQDILRNAFRKSIADARIHITDAAKRATGKDPGAYHAEKAAHDEMRLKRDAKNYADVEGNPLDPKRPGRQQFLDAMFTVKKGEEHLPPVGNRPVFHDYVEQVAKDAARDGDNGLVRELNDFLSEVRPNGGGPSAVAPRGKRELDLNWSTLRKHEAGSDKLEVLVNPTDREIGKLRVLPHEMRRNGRRDVRLRYLQDADKNIFVWRGDLATHAEVAPRLGVKTDHGGGASAADRGMIDFEGGKALFDGMPGRPAGNLNRLPSQALSTRALNAIDKVIGQDIEVAAAKTRQNDVRRLSLLRQALRATDPYTGLGDARGESMVGFSAQEAFDKGRKAFQNQVDIEDVHKDLADWMPQEIKDNFLMGMVRSMADRLANQSNLSELADAAGKIASTPAQRDKLIASLKTDPNGKVTEAGQQFLDMLDRVHNHVVRAKANYGGSATAPRLKAVEEAEAETGSVSSDIADLLGEILMREKGKIAGRVGARVRDWATRPGIRNPAINKALGTRLAATGEADVKNVLDEIRLYNDRPTPRLADPRIPDWSAALFGAQAGSATAKRKQAAAAR